MSDLSDAPVQTRVPVSIPGPLKGDRWDATVNLLLWEPPPDVMLMYGALMIQQPNPTVRGRKAPKNSVHTDTIDPRKCKLEK
jgi:hypothetical protein